MCASWFFYDVSKIPKNKTQNFVSFIHGGSKYMEPNVPHKRRNWCVKKVYTTCKQWYGAKAIFGLNFLCSFLCLPIRLISRTFLYSFYCISLHHSCLECFDLIPASNARQPRLYHTQTHTHTSCSIIPFIYLYRWGDFYVIVRCSATEISIFRSSSPKCLISHAHRIRTQN